MIYKKHTYRDILTGNICKCDVLQRDDTERSILKEREREREREIKREREKERERKRDRQRK